MRQALWRLIARPSTLGVERKQWVTHFLGSSWWEHSTAISSFASLSTRMWYEVDVSLVFTCYFLHFHIHHIYKEAPTHRCCSDLTGYKAPVVHRSPGTISIKVCLGISLLKISLPKSKSVYRRDASTGSKPLTPCLCVREKQSLS